VDDAILLKELTPVAERLLERHLTTAKEWYPHEYVPWSRGRDFRPGEEWEPSEVAPSPAVRSALFLNLLTEDNLPYYFGTIDRVFGSDDHAWRFWTRRWTAEEMRHAMVIRDYVVVTRAIDPVALERARMHQVSTGEVPEPPTVPEALVYVTLQELATRIAHRNTGRASGDEGCERLLARIAADENLHMLFYRNLLKAAFELDPNQTMRAVTDVVTTFQMPGTGMEGFARKAMIIAHEGIYDLRLHLDDVLMPVLRQWAVFDKTGLDAEGEKAREELSAFLDKTDATAARFVERREERRARIAARG
jgi:acyl-[acyl-carrier-protein] desaturase